MPDSVFTQDHRFLTLTTSLGENELLPGSFSVSDRISTPYRIEIDALAKTGADPDVQSLLGQSIKLTLAYGDLSDGERHFHGIVSEVVAGGETERFRHYRIVAVPELWLLTLSWNFQAFENMTTPDIVKQVLDKYSIRTEWQTQGSYSAWDFCFQYRESDFNFISRLLEHEGIFYYFDQQASGAVLVFADNPGAFSPSPDQASANYAPDIGAGDEDYVTDFEICEELRTGSYQAWDWHMEKAPSPAAAKYDTPGGRAGTTAYVLREFPARASQQFNAENSGSKMSGELNKLAKLRLGAIETRNPFYRAASTCRSFNAGQRFKLVGGKAPGDYVISAIEHAGSQYPPYISDMESPVLYTNTMECFDHGKEFRPPRTARRSLVHGPQTALVSDGPDKYGRMKVKFHWGESVTSCWVRVAQRWAGPTWGSIFLPRVNHEVIVDFIDGDPDQPLIVGSVYNAQNMPPYTLPANYTQSGIKTRSMSASGGQGGADEFNELRFEDKQGSEDIYFHAQKDFHRVVENDDDLKVGNDQTIEIKNNRTEVVKDGDEKVTIEKGKRSVFVNTGNDLHQVKKGNREAIIDMGNDSITVKMGNHMRKINLGKSETEAMQSITLKVGANKIVVDQTGITLDGIMIKLKGQAMIDSQAPMQKMNGDALIMIKGGITMIN